MFCTECGVNNSEGAVKCASCGHELEVVQVPVNTKQTPSPYQSFVSIDNTGFFSKLIGQNIYSTARAKWFYEVAEKIVNICVWICLVLAGIITLYLMSQSLAVGLINLGSQLFGFFFAFIALIFAKLGLMALGALIHISELLENGNKS